MPDFTVASAAVTPDGGGLPGRPDVAVPDTPDVFVAGDWVGPEGQLADAALSSARRAALAIAARLAAGERPEAGSHATWCFGMTVPLDEVFESRAPLPVGPRLSGSRAARADADDIVQETFLRAMARPPVRTDLPWRPWLVRVALNLGRDLLRARRRRGYPGPWLPSPVPLDRSRAAHLRPAGSDESPHARYDLVESVSFAFLLALEALTPAQRAVLLLRDVLDYSVKETAKALRMTAANVKTTHLRARRAMASYERDRVPGSSDRRRGRGALPVPRLPRPRRRRRTRVVARPERDRPGRWRRGLRRPLESRSWAARS